MAKASRGHKLMTKPLENKFRRVGEQDIPDPVVITKFFNPYGPHTWWVTEYNPKTRICFGFVLLDNPDYAELGSFSLDEIENVTVRVMGCELPLERDCHWQEKRLSEALAEVGLRR